MATLHAMADWTKSSLKLFEILSIATSSRLLKLSEILSSSIAPCATKVWKSTGENRSVECTRFYWIQDFANCRVATNSFFVGKKAKNLQTVYNAVVGFKLRTDLQFSEGRLSTFKERRGLRTPRPHEESGDCDMAAVAERLPILSFEENSKHTV